MASVGILHPGAMGARVGALLPDVLWAPEGRTPATAARAAAAGLREAPLTEILARCDVILSICPPHAALDVAHSARGFRGLYCDANAVAPATALEVARIVEEGGATYVDGGIVGGPPRVAGTRLYLSGSAAPAIADLFAPTLLEPIVLGGDRAAASALKMVYAGWSKGAAALLLALEAAADELGVGDALRAEWARSVPDVPARLEAARRSADAKGWRWIAEMREIEATLRAAGQPGGFHAAAAEVFERR